MTADCAINHLPLIIYRYASCLASDAMLRGLAPAAFLEADPAMDENMPWDVGYMPLDAVSV